MADVVCTRDLLREAATLYDSADTHLFRAARPAFRRGFDGGARWMRLALAHVRGGRCARRTSCDFTRLGVLKYAAALLTAAAATAATAAFVPLPVSLALAVIAFYVFECQLVFLFPLAIDGSPRPLRASREMTRRAGGTMAVLSVVMPVAAFMLVGGFAGRGFVRAWCLGCLAVVIWYERVRATCVAGQLAEVA